MLKYNVRWVADYQDYNLAIGLPFIIHITVPIIGYNTIGLYVLYGLALAV